MIKKFLVFSSIVFFVLVIGFIVSDDTGRVAQMEILPENHLQMKDVKFSHKIRNQDGYIIVRSKNAYYNNNEMVLYLNENEADMADGKNVIKLFSDTGVYDIDSYFNATGNIHGLWNDMAYKADNTTSYFNYNFNEGKALMGENVTFIQDDMRIDAKTALYDSAEKSTYFNEVIVDYQGGQSEKSE